MVTLVVVINTLISFLLFYIAWRVWKFKRILRLISDTLTNYEKCSHALLYTAPEKIYCLQQNIHHLRQGNQRLELQIQQIRQIMSLLILGRQIWQRYLSSKLLTLQQIRNS
ncbi:hypothetical protein H6G33_02050 [Calothrix sp. FACHB-1219]|uniref:hypothetical protein n=1 Tax=unclassified Calothrix TaxID=2619626 RepID=UPI0016869480|nr:MULTISPECIES: hypothetical protein [unclassified Calothrix]MBD2201386.1 hypothetical protein [Calothrix sp. FACHB-168]MBD2215818.1 hypothetical protein [Calothrix sp. FACHB-1219]